MPFELCTGFKAMISAMGIIPVGLNCIRLPFIRNIKAMSQFPPLEEFEWDKVDLSKLPSLRVIQFIDEFFEGKCTQSSLTICRSNPDSNHQLEMSSVRETPPSSLEQ